MSEDVRIALVAEGPTDKIVIEAALKAILPRTFVLTFLQPEATRPEMGSGWCGVLKWCDAFSRRGVASLEVDPLLFRYDMIILHIDADVAGKNYADCGLECPQLAAQSGWAVLPGPTDCPPPQNATQYLEKCLLSWLGLARRGGRTVHCIPSKAVESWLSVAVLPAGDPLLTSVECRLDLAKKLAILPKGRRVKEKSNVDYQANAPQLQGRWADIRLACSQAADFEAQVLAIPLP
ncbi:hypothetical protein [Magnetospirillum sulfuroxidans]|uniref:DUF4276 family protein n=1 Tax=Magnetospirillum sulfuroxidans TaxID=611300 RepID=A0ABS5IA63_9PROT|nr:hypothetical protein [Magnetospirillum sulfuroxidans]MBR9971321.1 hypothetical protein [Magnetospirillum sulfuroxidans]